MKDKAAALEAKNTVPGAQSSANQDARVIEIETLFVGGGPATISILSNAYQTARLEDLILGPFKGRQNMNRGPPPAQKYMSPSKLSKFVKDTNFNGKGIAIIDP